MKTQMRGNIIEFDTEYRPEQIIVNGKPMSMALYAEQHDGKNWRSAADGNHLLYAAEDGSSIEVPQKLFQNRIKALRTETGLSQKAFAEKFDIPRRTLENWESGEATPPGYVVKLIQTALEAEAQGEDDLTLEPEEIETHHFTVKGTPYHVTIEKREDHRINETYWQAWLEHENYGVKSHMFGVPTTQNTFEEVLSMVESDLEEQIDFYREEYED